MGDGEWELLAKLLQKFNASSGGPTTNPVSVPQGGTGRSTKLPYTVLGPAAGQFNTTANNGFAYEKITGNVYSSGTNVWSAVNSNWTAPEAGLLEIYWNVATDVFDGATVALFLNGSLIGYLRRLSVSTGTSSTQIIVAQGDVLDFRVNSNEISRAIYVNSAPIITFTYLPNY